jgi:O-methyltransferase
MDYVELFNRYSIISDQIGRPALGVVLRELETVLGKQIPGDIVEFGCYIGTTSLFIERLLAQVDPQREFWAYDSFAGLPDKTNPDESSAGAQFRGGELAVSKKQFLQQFQKAGLRAPKTYRAWFKDLTDTQLPEQIAFAFLDGDFYESIYDSLKLVWPRMAPGGTIAIDDYGREALPGVERAVHDFFNGQVTIQQQHNIGIIRL